MPIGILVCGDLYVVYVCRELRHVINTNKLLLNKSS